MGRGKEVGKDDFIQKSLDFTGRGCVKCTVVAVGLGRCVLANLLVS